MLEASEVTVRQALAAANPRDFTLKRAWPELIRALRERRRAGQGRGRLASRPEVDRLLQSAWTGSEADAQAIKALLRRLVRGGLDAEQRAAVAGELDARLAESLPRVITRPVSVAVQGWPPALPWTDLLRMLGDIELSAVEPQRAAGLLRDLDGVWIGGSQLRLSVALDAGERLPTPSRAQRGQSWRRRRADPWLPHWDAQGRVSLTPRSIAFAQARRLRGACAADAVVIDAFCGLGGNAIALASVGARVVAIERDPARLELARRNARALGGIDRIRFVRGDAAQQVPRWLDRHPEAAVFIDPPWGEPADRVRWTDLPASDLDPALSAASAVMLKLPRAFDLGTAPGRRWDWRCEFVDDAGDAAHRRVVKMLTALSG